MCLGLFSCLHQTSDFGAEFDVVIANILAPTLVTLMPEIARLMRPGGGEFEWNIGSVCACSKLAHKRASERAIERDCVHSCSSCLYRQTALGLCGVREHQVDMVLEAYKESFANVAVQAEDQGWVLITGVRKPRGH